MHTGDLARIDADGFTYLVDRAKDMINRGGENVYSVEVENALASAPGVYEVAVVGVPDPMMGEKVGAVVVPRADEAFDTEADAMQQPRVIRHRAARDESVAVPVPNVPLRNGWDRPSRDASRLSQTIQHTLPLGSIEFWTKKNVGIM